MALNLSTLTSPATSGDVLAEALTTADFLEGVPVLRNLARGSQKGGDAKQDVALNQPRALPLIKNPSGNLGGYLYIPNVSGNYATGPSVTIGANETWEGELDMVVTQWGAHMTPMGGGFWSNGFGLVFYTSGAVRLFSKGSGASTVASGVTLGTTFNVKYGFNGSAIYVDIDGTRVYSDNSAGIVSLQSGSITHTLELNQQANIGNVGNYAIQKAKLTVGSSVVFDCDFNGSTSIRHGDTKFNCVGGPVSLTKAGNDPVTVVKKSVLRFDGVTNGLKGLFDQTITDGAYMFAAFSVLGSGGESWGRVFSVNKTGGFDFNSTGNIFSAQKYASGDLAYAAVTGSTPTHQDLFDDENGDILHQVKVTNSAQSSLVNGADFQSKTDTLALEAQEFNIGKDEGITENGAIDLEYLALFPSSITDAQADSVRNYINNRNNVFDLKDGFGYYFYDAQNAPVGNISSGSSSWNGRIVGSDFGDTDRYLTQGTSDDQPVGDGFKVTFADNTDHLEIPQVTLAAGDSYAWMVCGTSLGTFAYKVTVSGQTELTLLGHLGSAAYRQAGDLYGIILLPASATGKDIEDARKLLIDRGAADGTTSGSIFANWYNRGDIVEFKHINTSSVTSAPYAWAFSSSLEKFPALDLSGATNISFAWYVCSSLNNFGAIDARNGTNFTSTWQDCSALSSFPADAKLGTAASSGVNFTSAWQDSGLTSFPPLDLSNGTTFFNAFRGTQLTTIDSGVLLGTAVASANVNFQNAFRDTPLTAFSALDLSKGKYFTSTWQGCSALTSFPSGAKLGTSASNVSFSSAWQDSGLTSFPALDLSSGTTFYRAWQSSDLISFPANIDLSSGIDFTDAWRNINTLLSFPAGLNLSSGQTFDDAWRSATSLTSFPLINVSSGKRFRRSWYNCSSMTDWPSGFFNSWSPSYIFSGVFQETWTACSALTASSVGNILQSIDASNQHGTDDGTSTGNPLGDSGIDIDYNVATGSLSAATTAAIDSLSGKGWEVFINGVLVIPNILDLQPAAAYSLRSFDADADPNVVNVRRSSDSALRDFKASEVSDGTLTTWVNNVVTLSPTLNNGGFEDGNTGYILGSNASIDTTVSRSGNNSGKLNVVGGAYTYFSKQNSPLEVGQQVKVSFYAKSSIADGTNRFRLVLGSANNQFTPSSTDWELYEVTQTVYSTTELTFARVGGGDFTIHIDDITVTNLTADGHVTTWYDQGGTNHATQSTASAQPKLVDAGTLVTEGGQAAVDFDGAGDYLNTLQNNPFSFTGPVSMSCAYYKDATAYKAYETLLSAGSTGNAGTNVGRSLALGFGNHGYISPSAYATDTWGPDGVRSNTAVSTNQRAIVTYNLSNFSTHRTAGNSEIRANGSALPVSAYNTHDPTGLNATPMRIGVFDPILNASFFSGTIQEIVVFNTDQATQSTGIENNINDTYTIY
jgi:hypothetical protein